MTGLEYTSIYAGVILPVSSRPSSQIYIVGLSLSPGRPEEDEASTRSATFFRARHTWTNKTSTFFFFFFSLLLLFLD